MSTSHGTFVWYDLLTSDAKAAQAFYCNVMGWSAKDSGVPGDSPYALFSTGPTMVAGLMQLPDEARARGARPAWNGYIAVDDVDAYAKKVAVAGGKIHRQPEDIPGVGRFAVAADPHGAVFLLFRGSSDEAPAPAAAGTPGHVGWRELSAGDGASDFAFYAGLFGWTKAEAVDMGDLGIYQTFATGGEPVGGVMTKNPHTPAASWTYYFNVDALDAALKRVRDGGGKVITEPMQVPGGSWIGHCMDPQGVTFALVATKR